MTKVINKKALLVLLTLIMAFCWLTVPVSAAEINSDADYSAEGTTAAPATPNSVYGILLNQIEVYPAKVEGNQLVLYTFGGGPYTASGPANILNVSIPSEDYQVMLQDEFDYFYCVLNAKVSGVNLKRWTVEVDGVIKKDATVVEDSMTHNAYVSAAWICPIRKTTTIVATVYDKNNVSAVATGHIYA